MQRTIQRTLVLLAIINIVFTQTSYFLDSESGKDSNCGSQSEPCIGLLSLPPLTDEGTSIIFAPGVYSTLKNFPYSVSNVNVTFHGQNGVIFQCDTEGTTNCLTITSPHGPSTISFQNIQFSGFNPNENGTEPMISITAPYTVQSFHSVLHTSSSVVQFLGCQFLSNTFTFPPFNPPGADPPTGNQTFPHVHFHPTQLINVNGVYVEIVDSLFSQNAITAISADFAHLSIDTTTFTQSFTNFSTQLISSSNSVLSITAGTITQNGLDNWESLITLSGVACYFDYEDDFSIECLPNTIDNTQITNNLNTAIIVELTDGAWIQITNSTFKENAAYLTISSQYSPVPVRVELNEVSFTNNYYGIVSALYAAGSYFETVSVDGTTGNETVMTFFEIPPGSSLSINNLQFNATISPFSIIQSSVILNNSNIATTSPLIPNIGGGLFPTTVYFQNSKFFLPDQFATIQGLTNVYFDGCTFSTYSTVPPITCFENSTQSTTMIFFVGGENYGYSSPLCSNLFCDKENQDLCPSNGATVNDDDNNNSDTSEIIAWVLASVLLFVVIVLGALLGFVGFKYFQLRRSYSTL